MTEQLSLSLVDPNQRSSNLKVAWSHLIEARHGLQFSYETFAALSKVLQRGTITGWKTVDNLSFSCLKLNSLSSSKRCLFTDILSWLPSVNSNLILLHQPKRRWCHLDSCFPHTHALGLSASPGNSIRAQSTHIPLITSVQQELPQDGAVPTPAPPKSILDVLFWVILLWWKAGDPFSKLTLFPGCLLHSWSKLKFTMIYNDTHEMQSPSPCWTPCAQHPHWPALFLPPSHCSQCSCPIHWPVHSSITFFAQMALSLRVLYKIELPNLKLKSHPSSLLFKPLVFCSISFLLHHILICFVLFKGLQRPRRWWTVIS